MPSCPGVVASSLRRVDSLSEGPHNRGLEFGNRLKETTTQNLMFDPAKDGLQRHQPGTPGRQLADNQTSQAFLLSLPVVSPNPGASMLRPMPRSSVPEENDETLIVSCVMSHQGFQESDRFLAVGLTFGPAQEGLLAFVIQGSEKSDRVDLLAPALRHPQQLVWGCPRPELVGPTHKPRLIQPHCGSVRRRAHHRQQPIPLAFPQLVEWIGASQPLFRPAIGHTAHHQQPSHCFAAHCVDVSKAGRNRLCQRVQSPGRPTLFSRRVLSCQGLSLLGHLFCVGWRSAPRTGPGCDSRDTTFVEGCDNLADRFFMQAQRLGDGRTFPFRFRESQNPRSSIPHNVVCSLPAVQGLRFFTCNRTNSDSHSRQSVTCLTQKSRSVM